jgi:allophanate hydrolase subunit 1
MAGRYDVVVHHIPEEGSRPEVLFRQAGDGFLQIEYGSTPRFDIVDSFRVQAINSIVKANAPSGFIESVPGLRTNLFHFDPEALDRKVLIAAIEEAEKGVAHVEDIEFPSRLTSLPIAFEDSETRKSVAKYEKEVRPGAPNVIDGYNIEYMAIANECSVQDVKDHVCGTEWYNSGNGFWPGGGFFWPLDPRHAINVPKYNPPRTWTPEGTVGIGGPCLYVYPTPTGGGYQLFGRTIPIFQFAQKHPLFKDGPTFFRAGDRIRFHPVAEEEVLDIYRHVHEAPYDYEYDIKEDVFRVADYLEFRNDREVQKGAAELQAKQAVGVKKAPAL